MPIKGARRVTDPVAAWYIEDILRGAPPPPNALSGHIAFKTGTSYGFRDALAVGFDQGDDDRRLGGRPDNGPTPGLIGRQAAAPILFDAFARLGREVEYPPAQRRARGRDDRRTAPAVRRLRKDAQDHGRHRIAALKIAFPPDGARIDLGLSRGAHAPFPKGARRRPPLTWFVNGAPIAAADLRRQSAWDPDGAGFARVSVMDAKGATTRWW